MMSSTKIAIRKKGRPPIGKKAATLYALRLPDEMVKAVKAYAKAHGIRAQSEAIRRMIEIVLKSEGNL